jgi:hypothetical protein
MVSQLHCDSHLGGQDRFCATPWGHLSFGRMPTGRAPIRNHINQG